MKRVLTSVAVLLMATGTSLASLSMWVKMGVASGGNPYTAEVVSDPLTVSTTDGLPVGIHQLNETFETFCVEKLEFFVSGVTYKVTIEPWAIVGGPDDGVPPPSADVLDSATAFLYDSWMKGVKTFNSVTYTAAEFQDAIWHLEGETTATGNALTLAQYATANNNGSLYNVRVMNLLEYAGGKWVKAAQSHLVQIPAPAAAGLVFVGLGLIGWFRRKLA